MSARRRAAGVVLVAAALFAAAACGTSGSSSGASNGATTSTSVVRSTFVVIGDDASAPVEASIPVGDSWPQRFFRTALTRDTVFVNLSTEAASSHLALDVELPIARQLHPTVAGIALGLTDAVEGNPPQQVGASIDALITGLRAAGARTVLVATVPAGVPYSAAFDRVIVDTVRRDGAVLVDLAPLPITFVRNQTAIAPIPDRASQHRIGDAFIAAYRRARTG